MPKIRTGRLVKPLTPVVSGKAFVVVDCIEETDELNAVVMGNVAVGKELEMPDVSLLTDPCGRACTFRMQIVSARLPIIHLMVAFKLKN